MNNGYIVTKKLARDFVKGDQIKVRGVLWTITGLLKYGDYDHSWIVKVHRKWKGRDILDSFTIDKMEEWETLKQPPLRVGTFREAGLEARWSKTSSGAPAIFVRNPKSHSEHQRKNWWLVSDRMWKRMLDAGILEGFDQCTLIGDIFSLPA
jgi:hypothetical protein